MLIKFYTINFHNIKWKWNSLSTWCWTLALQPWPTKEAEMDGIISRPPFNPPPTLKKFHLWAERKVPDGYKSEGEIGRASALARYCKMQGLGRRFFFTSSRVISPLSVTRTHSLLRKWTLQPLTECFETKECKVMGKSVQCIPRGLRCPRFRSVNMSSDGYKRGGGESR